ncbi:hypothetical protein BH11MYX4_BH11MYX4_19950 [soil metagenome]
MVPRSHSPLRRSLRITLFALSVPVVAAGVALVTGRGAHAEGGEADKVEQNERCAIRLSIALQGKSADAALLAAADPQASIDAMVASPEFAERYARFINSEFNGGPSTSALEDPVYYLAKYVLTNKKPWSDLFIGPYKVVANATAMDVASDPNGLGYFRTPAWMKRYAGNEPQGYMLSASFRILSNTTGLMLTPSVGNPGDDRTANGRSAAACKSCHFDNWFALDKFARLLPMKKPASDPPTFTPPTEGPQQLLGKTLANDKELVTALVDSDAWRFNQCRTAFKFLYGRPENMCEAKTFDACVDALANQKTIQSAVAAVAKDASFCSQ